MELKLKNEKIARQQSQILELRNQNIDLKSKLGLPKDPFPLLIVEKETEKISEESSSHEDSPMKK